MITEESQTLTFVRALYSFKISCEDRMVMENCTQIFGLRKKVAYRVILVYVDSKVTFWHHDK